MIILEGPDGAGKTRLALRLSEELQVPINPKVVQADMSTEVDLAAWCRAQMGDWPRPVIYDRFPLISEFVYGPVFKHDIRPAFKNYSDLYWLHQQFAQHDPVVVYCLPPIDEVLSNINREDTDNEAVRGTAIAGVYWNYFNQAARSTPQLVWDYTQPTDYNTLVQKIRRHSWERNKLEYK